MNEQSGRRYYGKYRGTVMSNIDPLQLGRILVKVPDVLGDNPSIWAISASPIAGRQMGMYAMPSPGDGVWVEFEQGNLDSAIWTGSWRGSPIEVPAMALAAPPTNPPIVVQSITQNKIIISSVPGDGITLETALGVAGPFIQINATGIYISDGKGGSITIAGGTVVINQGALIIK